MSRTDAEIRHMAIQLLTSQTDRDKQTRIGASNLSNGCDRCLAANFLGDQRETPRTAKTWMGRVLGTAFHAVLEDRVGARMKRQIQDDIDRFIKRYPGAEAERHVFFCEIVGYGSVGGTIDLDLVDHIVDWKGSTRKKLCTLIDYLEISQGKEPIFGRTHKDIKLSEREYAAEMEKMQFKVAGYYGQQTLYMHGSGRERASLVFLNRDGTGYFDVPTDARYDDPKAVHDVFVLSFGYSREYAEALIARGQAIWDALQQGAKPEDFESHPHCFPCSQDSENYADKAQNIELQWSAAA